MTRPHPDPEAPRMSNDRAGTAGVRPPTAVAGATRETTETSIAELMEPFASLPIITAHEGRLSAWGADPKKWQWTTSDEITSPLGWWTATIGTDHGPASADHRPVRWQESYDRDPYEYIADAWLVWARLSGPARRITLTEDGAGRFTVAVWDMEEGGSWTCAAEEEGETAPIAICEAFRALSTVEEPTNAR